jgi:succinoglycan biosynthesis transport protein ExoP
MVFVDYLRMLRRGWPVVVLFTLFCLGVASVYVIKGPKTFQSTAILYVSTVGTGSPTDLSVGSQFAAGIVRTYAAVGESPIVLGPVIEELSLRHSTPAQLSKQLDMSAPEGLNLISITASDPKARGAADLANAVASQMIRVIPSLDVPTTGVRAKFPVHMRQIQTAAVPTKPVSPNAQRVMALALILGLFLGLGLVILAQALDTKIRRPRDLWQLTDVPLVAAIPDTRRGKASALLVRDDLAGSSSEAFRTLRTNIRFLETSDRRSIVVTSAVDDKGGLNISANLAWALAEAGYSVALIDSDLRHPRLGAIMNVEGSLGLSDVIVGHAPLEEILRSTSHPRLKVILAGTRPPNPSELLGSGEMLEILSRVEAEFDYVIIDTPPVLARTDAALVSAAAERVVLCVAAGRTRINEMSAAMLAMNNVGVKPLGIVLTRVKSAGMDLEDHVPPPGRRAARVH